MLSMNHVRPPHLAGRVETDIAAGLAVLGYSVALNRVLPRPVHVPANLAVAAGAVLVTHALGASWDELGLAPSNLAAGARWGLAVAVPVIAGTGVAVAIPAIRPLFEDERVRVCSRAPRTRSRSAFRSGLPFRRS